MKKLKIFPKMFIQIFSVLGIIIILVHSLVFFIFPKTYLETRKEKIYNIADKNANYCELTALYWIWKNIKKVKVIGICHYRRYFTKLKWSNKEKFFLKQKDINRLLDKYEIIVPKKTNLKKYSVKDWYVKCDGRNIRN